LHYYFAYLFVKRFFISPDCSQSKQETTTPATAHGDLQTFFVHRGETITQNKTSYSPGLPFMYRIQGASNAISRILVTMRTETFTMQRDFAQEDFVMLGDGTSVDMSLMLEQFDDGMIKIEVQAFEDNAAVVADTLWVELRE
jgi:hypothetical protein